MIELVYLNENISKKDADALVCSHNKRKEKLFKQMLSNAESMNPEASSKYISSCMTIFTIF